MIHFRSETLRNSTAALLLLAATSALADEGVLVSNVPSGLASPAIVETARRALLQRSWTVLRTDQASVDAQRKKRGTDATVTLFVADGILKYRGSAKVSQAWGAGKEAKMVTADGPIPEDWLEDLRDDIERSLVVAVPSGKGTVAPPETSVPTATSNTGVPKTGAPTAGASTAAPANGSTADKLRELEQLRKDKLISEPEYQQMRKAILDAFQNSTAPNAR